PDVAYADSIKVNLPLEYFKSEELKHRVDLKTSFADISIPDRLFEKNELSESEFMTVIVSRSNKSRLESEVRSLTGDRPVIGINVRKKNEEILSDSLETPLKVSIPYIPSEEELKNTENIVVIHIKDDGSYVVVQDGVYDHETGKVIFEALDCGQYAVAYVKKTFKDIRNGYWAKSQIEALASRGIISGRKDSTFRPADNVTRADFIVLLVKTLGLNAGFDNNFSDVRPTDYYYKPLGIAKKLGISEGDGNNKFNPGSLISRQDMMTLTAKALKITGKIGSENTGSDIDIFKDSKIIASYAKGAVSVLVGEKIIKGNGEYINPYANATRAETAVIMHRLLYLVNTGKEPPEKEPANDRHNKYTVLVNKTYKLSPDYIPENLTVPRVRFLSQVNNKMSLEAAQALEKLFDDALKDKIILLAASGFRDYNYQQKLFNDKERKCGTEEAEKYVAPPGASEHQLGLAMDVVCSEYRILDEGFCNTEAYKWLEANCSIYGFIIRYPKDKENITTYNFEPWHLRYVGIEAASEIMNKGITLEEYLGE
ncbi:MAG: hypothetical protein GX660_25790, partial [Clostridiaceae bacterium]|nr:hypothetical protein [Clostridiaceae bacterium]